MIRRALTVLAAVALLTLTPAAAVAADEGGRAGSICSATPDLIADSETASGFIDLGSPPDTATGGGTYTRSGWGGFTSHRYDPGCAERIIDAVAERIPGFGLASQASNGSLASNAATGTLGLLALIGAAATVTMRVATEPGVLWDALTVGLSATTAAAGWPMYVAWVWLSCVSIGLYFLWRRDAEMPEQWTKNATALAVLASGVVIGMWHYGPGPHVDRAVNVAYVAAGQTATGQNDAAAAFADLYTDHLLIPVYGLVHFGPDMDAVTTYAARLHQASTPTRAEAARAATDSAYRAELETRKAADYRAVAADVASTHPPSYEQLTGGSGSRFGWAVAGVFIAVPLVGVVFLLAAVMILGRIIVRFGVAVFPGAALVLAHPSLHGWARAYAREVAGWGLASVGAAAGLAFFLRIVLSTIGVASNVSVTARMLSAAIVAWIVLWYLTSRWKKVAARAKVEKQAAQARWAAATAAEQTRRAAEKAKAMRHRDDQLRERLQDGPRMAPPVPLPDLPATMRPHRVPDAPAAATTVATRAPHTPASKTATTSTRSAAAAAGRALRANPRAAGPVPVLATTRTKKTSNTFAVAARSVTRPATGFASTTARAVVNPATAVRPVRRPRMNRGVARVR